MLALAAAITLTANVIIPYQWLEACWRDPRSRCEVSRLTIEDIAWLNLVVNTAIRPEADAPGTIDQWTAFPADRKGDCEDYVMTKRAALITLGFDPRSMTMVMGYVTREGSERLHAVLEVTVDGKRWVLDNLEKTPYDPDHRPRPWREVARQPVSGAVWNR